MDSDYGHVQKVKYRSFESENPRWVEGQQRFIESFMVPHLEPEDLILDCACGDGIGLEVLRKFGFHQLVGVEFEPLKRKRAIERGCGPVLAHDFHDPHLSLVREVFDVIYSSHSLEHAYDPNLVLENFHSMLQPGGQMFLVLPYPDTGPDDAHCGKYILGTAAGQEDQKKLLRFVQDRGFELLEIRFDDFREPEVWLRFRRGIK